MQQQVDEWDLKCTKHGEKIISVQVMDTGDNQMFCLKCFTEKQMSLVQLAQQLSDLREKKRKQLIENGKKSEKRQGSLKKLFLTIKEQFNQSIDQIIKSISDSISQTNENIKQECELLKQPIQQLNITQVNDHIKELKKQDQVNDLLENQDKSLRNKMIIQYIESIKQLNKLIKSGSNWQVKDDDVQKQVNILNNTEQQQNLQANVTQYKQVGKQEGVSRCCAMTMDKDEKIIVNGQDINIQIWEFNQQGTIKLKQTLEGHTDVVQTLCFSQKGLWFISGSCDKTIRIWKCDVNDDWKCQQIIKESHSGSVFGIVLNQEEDQFISCSLDKTIKIWIKQKDGIQWECIQTLTEHSVFVLFLSFSPDNNLLASSGLDSVRIWQIGQDKKLIEKQVIQGGCRLRISFIDNNEFIASTFLSGRLLRYTQNKEGLFKLKAELKLNSIKEYNPFCFPLIYNKSLRLVILRHSDEHTYILKQQKNEKFSVHQELNGQYKAGYLLRNGEYLILYDYINKCLEVMKQ